MHAKLIAVLVAAFIAGTSINAAPVTTHLSDLDLCVNIALSDSGFGSKFTEETPLVIVAVGSDEDLAQQFTEEAKTVAAKYGGRVQVQPLNLAASWQQQEVAAD